MLLNDHRKDLIGFAYFSMVACIAIAFLYRAFDWGINGRLFFQRIPGGYAFNDYVAFYSAGKIVLSNMRSAIYDPATQISFYNQTISQWCQDYKVESIPLGQSVPWFFAIMAPFALLPIQPSLLVWNLVGSALSIAGLVALLTLKHKDARYKRIFIVGMLGCFPTQWLIRDGQNSWFLLAPLCLYLYGFLTKKDILGGAGLALLLLKPQYAIFMAMPALACRRWKLIVSSCAVGALEVLGAAGIFGMKTMLQYPSVLHATESSNPAVFPTWMICLRGPLTIFLGLDRGLAISSAIYLIALLAVLAFWIKSVSKASEQRVDIAFAITLMACLLASPHTHMYDYVVVAAVAALSMPQVEWFKTAQLNKYARKWCRALILLPFTSFALYVLTDRIPIGEIIGLSFFLFDLWLFTIVCRWYKFESDQPASATP